MRFIPIFLLLTLLIGCKSNAEPVDEQSQNTPRILTKDFKEYWFSGQAEITSYDLEQYRYGELREGTAVLIFVTEDFLPEVQVKANQKSKTTKPILKLNKTKNFNTGIYPYSIMTSVFYPLEEQNHALKITNSVQEWCGHVYAQLNNRNDFEIKSHSYFEGEADQEYKLSKTFLEDELWTQLRVNPLDLPVGEIQLIPSMEFSRLIHKAYQPYTAIATLEEKESFFEYCIKYPELDRKLTIWFEHAAPYTITQWKEQIGNETTQATKMKSIKSTYWSKNKNKDASLRDSLQLN